MSISTSNWQARRLSAVAPAGTALEFDPAPPFTIAQPATISILNGPIGPNGASITVTYGGGDTTTFTVSPGGDDTQNRSGDSNNLAMNAAGDEVTFTSPRANTGLTNIVGVAA